MFKMSAAQNFKLDTFLHVFHVILQVIRVLFLLELHCTQYEQYSEHSHSNPCWTKLHTFYKIQDLSPCLPVQLPHYSSILVYANVLILPTTLPRHRTCLSHLRRLPSNAFSLPLTFPPTGSAILPEFFCYAFPKLPSKLNNMHKENNIINIKGSIINKVLFNNTWKVRAISGDRYSKQTIWRNYVGEAKVHFSTMYV